jgi:hypothetical protein
MPIDNVPEEGIVALQVGSYTILRGLAQWKIGSRTNILTIANVGSNGIYGEVGLRQAWGDLNSSQWSVQHGILGSIVKVKVVRSGHTLSVPIHLTERYQDWQTVLLAVVVPPAVGYLVSRY